VAITSVSDEGLFEMADTKIVRLLKVFKSKRVSDDILAMASV
jgi:hypothetical protein